jgi:type IV pilus assembly protein PilC
LAILRPTFKAGPFHKALLKHPNVFRDLYQHYEANEKAGTLDSGLKQIAKELKQQIEMRSQIQRAVTQPAIIVCLAIAVVILMVIVVLPPLVEVFRQFGAELPITTKVLIAFSDFVNANKIALAIGILVMVLLLIVLFRQPKTKTYMDKWLLRVPMLGELLIWHNTARLPGPCPTCCGPASCFRTLSISCSGASVTPISEML